MVYYQKKTLQKRIEACEWAHTLLIGYLFIKTSWPHQKFKITAGYANTDFSGKVSKIASNYRRVDIVFDDYRKDSLKSYTRMSRGEGRRCKVTPSGKVPQNWQSFLRNDDNKMELFILLAKSIYTIDKGIVYCTIKDSSICNKVIRSPINCSHEEADTRVFVHLKHAIQKDCITTASIQSNDTDIIVIAISFFHEVLELGLKELWVSLGVGKTKNWYPIHDLADQLGPLRSKGLLFFHAISGCDNVSAFRNKGKKTFFQTWDIFPDVTDTFAKLSSYPFTIDDSDMMMIERFIILLYDRSSISESVDSTRKKLFMQKNTQFDSLPPTGAALKYQILRAAYQAGIVWGQSLEQKPVIHSPEQWGWQKNSEQNWDIYWTHLSAICDSCAELCKCGCRKKCNSNCSCQKSCLPCTARCGCPCV